MSYKQSPFPMASGTSRHASALKDKGSAKHMKEFGADHDSNAFHPTKEDLEREKQISKEHDIASEKLNTTGKTCGKCGANINNHEGKDHAFEVVKPPGPDTKPKE